MNGDKRLTARSCQALRQWHWWVYACPAASLTLRVSGLSELRCRCPER